MFIKALMMNKLKSLVRYSAIGGVIALGLGMLPSAQALVGQCEPAGSTMGYHFTFNQLFDHPDKNTAGKTFYEVNRAENVWQNEGDGYLVNCDCGSATQMKESFIMAVPRGMPLPDGNGTRQFYSLSGSEDFSAAMEVYIAGDVNQYFPVPFPGNGWRGNGFSERPQNCRGVRYDSGAQGLVHLYFRQAVIGTSTITDSPLLDVYINSDPSVVRGGRPTATVSMSGTITVPQKCELKNSMITVPFGSIMSADFKVKGQKPSTVTMHEETLYLECTNLSTRAKISLLFEGEVNPHDPTALKTTTTNGSVTTDNDDIAIRIEEKRNGNTQVISPGDKLSMAMNGLGNIDSDSQTTLNIYPISTTGKAPKVGDFEATATITIKME
jgi:type 1 fimbria pilin